MSLARSAVMGGTAMNLGLTGQAELSRALAGSGEEGAIFALFDHLPLPPITSVAVMVLIALFSVSSADSASLALGMFRRRGALAPHCWLVAVWGWRSP